MTTLKYAFLAPMLMLQWWPLSLVAALGLVFSKAFRFAVFAYAAVFLVYLAMHQAPPTCADGHELNLFDDVCAPPDGSKR